MIGRKEELLSVMANGKKNKVWNIDELKKELKINGNISQDLNRLDTLKYIARVGWGEYVISQDGLDTIHGKELKEMDEDKKNALWNENDPKSVASKLFCFLTTQKTKEISTALLNETPVFVDYNELVEYDSRMADLIDSDFEDFKNNASKVFYETLSEKNENRYRETIPFVITSIPGINLPIRNIRAIHNNKYISVVGRIRGASNVKQVHSYIGYDCQECGNRVYIEMVDGTIDPPPFCYKCKSRRSFEPKIEKTIDIQTIKIEEDIEEIEGSVVTQNIEAVLLDYLVDKDFQKTIIPGSKVRVSGMLCNSKKKNRRGQTEAELHQYIKANEVVLLDDALLGEITDKDLEDITALSKKKDIHGMIARSISPSIHGHDDIKKGIALALFGGVAKTMPTRTTRKDIHILLVGDPGTGKSVILKELTKIMPRSAYCVAVSSSGVGLTASAIQSKSGEWSIEAGAIPMCTNGVVCIDELDKTPPEELHYLNESMEQQTISVNKAGIQATLSAKTTVIAAANPKLGRFDSYDDPLSQVHIDATLMSRFDLIFIVKDIYDRKKEEAELDKILSVHTKDEKAIAPDIPAELLKKYITHARRTCNPRFGSESGEKCKKFYIKLREQFKDNKKVSMGKRQFEAIIRLSEASAKMRFSETVQPKDVDAAIKIVTDFVGNFGFDIDYLETKATSSKREKYNKIIEIIKTYCEENKSSKGCTEDHINERMECICSEELDKLKSDGCLFMPVSGRWRAV